MLDTDRVQGTIAVLASKRPEQPCRAFKAEQVNLVLKPGRFYR